MSRCLLHKNKVEEFMEWLDSKNIPHRPGRGDYQIMQVLKDNQHWCGVFWRHHMPEHYTVDRRIESLVRRYCRERKQADA